MLNQYARDREFAVAFPNQGRLPRPSITATLVARNDRIAE